MFAFTISTWFASCCVAGIDSSSPLIYTKRAAAYISLRQQASALRDFDKALEIDPTNVGVGVASQLAVMLPCHQLSTCANSKTNLRTTLPQSALFPRFLQGYMNRGKLLRQICSLDPAERDFKSVLGLKPDHKSAAKVCSHTQSNSV
jgi:DnaJ family protein C protein 3